MDHFQEIREKLAERELDAMMLTNEANRLYATGFHSTDTDGLALVTRKNTYYFTDSRYTEAAQRVIKNAVMREVGAGRGYGVLVEEVIREEGLQKIGFEDAYMTVQDYERYRKALSCELVPATDLMLQYITAGKAAIDGLPCEKPDKTVSEGMKISVRGLGKIKLAQVNGKTKKDRISVVIHRYV